MSLMFIGKWTAKIVAYAIIVLLLGFSVICIVKVVRKLHLKWEAQPEAATSTEATNTTVREQPQEVRTRFWKAPQEAQGRQVLGRSCIILHG